MESSKLDLSPTTPNFDMLLPSAITSTSVSADRDTETVFESPSNKAIDSSNNSFESSVKMMESAPDTNTRSMYRLHETEIPESHTVIAQPQARISYENGFGDFSFGRSIEWHKKSVFAIAPPPGPPGIYTSNNVLFEELDGYLRFGAFPFFELPIEIRTRIFKLLLAPLYLLDDQKREYICVHVGRQSFASYRDGYYARSYEDIKKNTESRSEDELPVVTISPEEHKRRKEKFEREKRLHLRLNVPHPGRKLDCSGRHYSMNVYVKMKGCNNKAWSEPMDWPYVDMLRQISNVSTLFREEFGQVFWERTSVDYSLDYDFSWLGNFLEERPRVCSGIKHLDLAFDTIQGEGLRNWDQFGDAKRTVKLLEQLTQMQRIAKLLEVETLSICFSVEESNLGHFISDEGTLMAFSVFREMKVSKNFSLCLCIQLDEANMDSESDETAAHRNELEQNYESKFKSIVMPDTLRVKTAETDRDISGFPNRFASSPTTYQGNRRLSRTCATVAGIVTSRSPNIRAISHTHPTNDHILGSNRIKS